MERTWSFIITERNRLGRRKVKVKKQKKRSKCSEVGKPFLFELQPVPNKIKKKETNKKGKMETSSPKG